MFKPPIQFIHSNYFWLKLNRLISLWYSAVPNTISPLRQKYLEHDVWITPRNIIYLASCGIFLTAIFLIPFIYLVKELFAFSYILSQQYKRRSYKCHNKSIGALDNKHPHNYHTQLQYPGWLKIPCLIKNIHLFFLFWLFCCSVAGIHIWQGWAHKLFF